MKNGDYILVVAPPDYPGKRYRDKYCYEHILVAWKKYGRMPTPDENVHHKNKDKHDNRDENVVIISSEEHQQLHAAERAVDDIVVECAFCKIEYGIRPNHYRSFVKRGQTMHCSRSCSVRNQHRRGLCNLVGRYPVSYGR
jgi:HNH endonuclease